MLAAYLSHSISRSFGGIYETARRTAQSVVAQRRWQVASFGVQDSYTSEDIATWHPVEVQTFPAQGPQAFGYAPGLATALDQINPEIAHVHGLWTYTSKVAYTWAKKKNRSYMVSIHGMLDPWALKNSAWKKSVAGWLFQKSALKRARCIVANTQSEFNAIRGYGLKNPVCFIPHGVDLPAECSKEPPPWKDVISADKKVLLFMGRIHPKKGLVHLLEAWAKVRQSGNPAASEWELAVIGWDQGEHESFLRTLANENQIQDSVHWLGPRFGREKAGALQAASAFVLPSFSEGLPVAVLESMAYQLPLLITPECNVPEAYEHHCGVRIDPNVESISRGLHELFSTSQSEREDMGKRGRQLVQSKFTWQQVAEDLSQTYDWIVGGGPCPDCVHLA